MREGHINNVDKMAQVINYEGIGKDGIRPMDIDGFIEYHDKGFIVYEFKYADPISGRKFGMSEAQEAALTRLVDALESAGKEAILFQCEHHMKDERKAIPGKDAVVVRTYWHGRWWPPKGHTVKVATYRFLNSLEGGQNGN